MINFLFWNVRGKALYKEIARIAKYADTNSTVDIILLAEGDGIIPSLLERELYNFTNQNYTYVPQGQCKKIWIWTREHSIERRHLRDTEDMTGHLIWTKPSAPILLVATHLPSKRYKRAASQRRISETIASDIASMEKKAKHENTILVGDLNMDPFEPSIHQADAMNAVNSKYIAKRTEASKSARFASNKFYNPMWSHMGDANTDPPGTYFYHENEVDTLFWHVFDQVLCRPTLLNKFDSASLKVIARVPGLELCTSNGIPKKTYSDHLPLFFSCAI